MLILQVGEKPCRRASDEADLYRHWRAAQQNSVGSGCAGLSRDGPLRCVLLDLDLPVLPGHELIRNRSQSQPDRPHHRFHDPRRRARQGPRARHGRRRRADELLSGRGAAGSRAAPSSGAWRGRTQSVLRVGNLELSTDAHEISVRGVRVHFTPKEYAILEFLARKPGRPVSKGACLSYLYGGEDEPDPKILDVIICRVRKKLATAGVPHLLESVRGLWLQAVP